MGSVRCQAWSSWFFSGDAVRYSSMILQIVIILLLIVGNGVLAMSELAVVSARKPRLQQMAEEGNEGAKVALELANHPGHFLSAVQVGITLVGILAGAFGGATLAEDLAPWIARVPLLAPYANALSVGLVVLIITYLSLVIGELVPKRLALRNAERTAAAIARPMRRLAQLTSPLVHLLSVSTDFVLRIFGVPPVPEPAVTEEEVRIMLEQGAQLGVFERMEEEMVGQVFRLADRKIGAVMTPRPDIVWIDVEDDVEAIREKISSSGRSRFPVGEGNLDQVLGIALAKDLLAQSLAGIPIDVRAVLKPALFVPESTPALNVVERFKETQSKLALVIDEFGGVEGLVTVDDILEAIIGEIPEPDEAEEPQAMQREDGSWLIDGMFAIDEFCDLFEVDELPEGGAGYYQTVGGFVMASLGQVPAAGDHFNWDELRIEVMDMDGRRVDKVLVTRAPQGVDA